MKRGGRGFLLAEKWRQKNMERPNPGVCRVARSARETLRKFVDLDEGDAGSAVGTADLGGVGAGGERDF